MTSIDNSIQNPAPLGWPWSSPDLVTDDPEARVLSLPCGCYQRVDGESVLCAMHLDALNDRCNFQPEDWGDWPGVDGPVMLCNTHGYPADGDVYGSEPNTAVGACQAVATSTPTSSNGAPT